MNLHASSTRVISRVWRGATATPIPAWEAQLHRQLRLGSTATPPTRLGSSYTANSLEARSTANSLWGSTATPPTRFGKQLHPPTRLEAQPHRQLRLKKLHRQLVWEAQLPPTSLGEAIQSPTRLKHSYTRANSFGSTATPPTQWKHSYTRPIRLGSINANCLGSTATPAFDLVVYEDLVAFPIW